MSFLSKIFFWFISLLLLIPFQGIAQEHTQDSLLYLRSRKSNAPIATVVSKKQKTFFERDLKIGWDVSNILLGALSPKRSGLDFSIDMTLKENLYGIIELGNNNYEGYSDIMTYLSKGNYFKLGLDFDMRKNKADKSRDIFYLGLRYAFASFQQEMQNYSLSASYWPPITDQNAVFHNQAHWVEAITGFKVEVFKNMYLGLGLRFKLRLLQTGDKILNPAPFIPGFGKTTGALVVGFNYNLYYNLPLNYKKKSSNRAE
ncbi:MAG: hypothetical protein JW857_00915 [Bacteroidales bacterium]|nr:hypothetical protein [Bacteroidales bacterium]